MRVNERVDAGVRGKQLQRLKLKRLCPVNAGHDRQLVSPKRVERKIKGEVIDEDFSEEANAGSENRCDIDAEGIIIPVAELMLHEVVWQQGVEIAELGSPACIDNSFERAHLDASPKEHIQAVPGKKARGTHTL